MPIFRSFKSAYNIAMLGALLSHCAYSGANTASNKLVNPDLASEVNPLIGSSNLGNTFPGPVMPFGMFSFSPEMTKGEKIKPLHRGVFI